MGQWLDQQCCHACHRKSPSRTVSSGDHPATKPCEKSSPTHKHSAKGNSRNILFIYPLGVLSSCAHRLSVCCQSVFPNFPKDTFFLDKLYLQKLNNYQFETWNIASDLRRSPGFGVPTLNFKATVCKKLKYCPESLQYSKHAELSVSVLGSSAKSENVIDN